LSDSPGQLTRGFGDLIIAQKKIMSEVSEGSEGNIDDNAILALWEACNDMPGMLLEAASG